MLGMTLANTLPMLSVFGCMDANEKCVGWSV